MVLVDPVSELAALRVLLTDALARLEALERAEATGRARERQAELLSTAAAILDPQGSRWSRAQALARRVAARARSTRPPATEVDRLVAEAMSLGPVPTSPRRLWECLPAERQTRPATVRSSPPPGGTLWSD